MNLAFVRFSKSSQWGVAAWAWFFNFSNESYDMGRLILG